MKVKYISLSYCESVFSCLITLYALHGRDVSLVIGILRNIHEVEIPILETESLKFIVKCVTVIRKFIRISVYNF